MFIALIFICVAASLPLGMMIYSIKTTLGWNLFTFAGYHSFSTCLQQELAKTQFSPASLSKPVK